MGKQFASRPTPDNRRRAAAAYEKALQLDPQFAPAWAGLAGVTFALSLYVETATAVSEGYQRAMAAAEKAVALDPELADGYAVRGSLRIDKADWAGARADVERALALNPGSAGLHLSYAWIILLPLGRLPEAIREAQKATDLDPLSAGAWSSLGTLYMLSGQPGPAQAALERSLRIFPEQNVPAAMALSATLLFQKKPSETLAMAEQIAFEPMRLSMKALALHDLGRKVKAAGWSTSSSRATRTRARSTSPRPMPGSASPTSPSSGWTASTPGTVRDWRPSSRSTRSFAACTPTRASPLSSRR